MILSIHGRLTRVAILAAAVTVLPLACKKLEQVDLPGTNPNPSVGTLPTAAPGGDVVGRPGGSTPTPTPTGSPSTSPSASPVPTTSPGTSSCSLPPLPDGSPCQAETPAFQVQVETAQAEVLRTRPDLFDGNRVRSEDSYVQEVARVLRTRGICAAQGGPKDEIAVKTSNTSNDQYDIVLGSGQTWTSYQVTCRPARF